MFTIIIQTSKYLHNKLYVIVLPSCHVEGPRITKKVLKIANPQSGIFPKQKLSTFNEGEKMCN
jgi:hypothetical protein